MHPIDWIIVASLALILGAIAIYTNRYMKGIADFLAANRLAGRYMLTLADGMAGLGAIGIIATFQQFYQGGLGAAWWGQIMAPVLLLLPLTGFIIYRFRSSRVMTIAEFYEKRYSRRFRIFAGMLAFFAGVINYGVFPQVTARFLIYFCEIPQYSIELGTFTVDLTLGFMMALLLMIALALTIRGGQIAIMITDFLQAQFLNIVFLLILGVLLWHFTLSDVIETLKTAPSGQSMLDPFDQGDIPDFNMFFFFIMAFNAVYTYMAWQGNQGYNCAARNPHEAKMARILAAWRFGATWTV
ncbi:MAG: sodium:solute symporter, partial [Candidatus Sumerlaeia bacterium]|nr:sodium:solute symporter [Candidatus Sumerlaeia bacterium]